MAAKVKRVLRVWMVIYAAFAAAFISSAASGLQTERELLHMPPYETTGSLTERRFFESRRAQPARTDI